MTEQLNSGHVPEVEKGIVAVSRILAQRGVAKSGYNQAQKFKFRSIDDVQAALSAALVESSVSFTPYVRRVVSDSWRLTKNGGDMHHIILEVVYTIASAIDGSSRQVCVYGEGMDSGDKAVTKALSAAFKYAAVQTFCIPLEGVIDADETSPEVSYSAERIGEAPETERPSSKAAGKKGEEPAPEAWEEGECEAYGIALEDIHPSLSIAVVDAYLAERGQTTLMLSGKANRAKVLGWLKKGGIAKVLNN